jgi:glycosyltransferase involved in cell wall biosynthesis
MVIAFISLMRAFPWGGSEELWFQTARLALAQGHQVRTLTQRWDVQAQKITQLRQLGAETLFYDTAQYSIASRAAIKLGLKQRVAYATPNLEADVYVVSNGSTWDFVLHYSLVQKLCSSGKPYLLISQHNFENGHVVAESHRRNAITIIESAAQFFFVSERNRQVAERQLGYSLGNAQVISNPVNTKHKGIKPFPAADTLLLACVARLECDFKGQDILLQALSTQQWLARDFKLRLYGSGPHKAHLQGLIELYGLQAKVSIEGQVEDVDTIWLHNQALILPSLSEGTPLALIEAMLAGRTALVTDVGGNGSYVLTGATGYLAATASLSCLAASLEELWLNRHQLQELGEAAFAHAAAITDFHPDETLWQAIQSAHSPVEVAT